MTIRDTDRGYRRLLDRMSARKRSAAVVSVGVSSRHADVLDAAIAAEFGTSTEPQRSFLRAWFDTHRAENLERLRRAARRVASGENEREVLAEIGAEMVAEIRDRLSAGIDPPLAESTAREKGTSVPLVGGELEHAIEAEVSSS